METICPFAKPVREFLTYLRVEAGLASATLEAYGSDLEDLLCDLRKRRISSIKNIKPQHLADHLRSLHRDRELQPVSVHVHILIVMIPDVRAACA